MTIIAHLDMDAFFAAVEERDNPAEASKPIVVGADPEGGRGRGVVATASYAARAYGIHSAMPISRAWAASEAAARAGRPPAVFLPVDFQKYGRVSDEIMALVRSRVPLVEEASIDEAYLDVSFCGTFEKAEALCGQLKKEIREKERLTCSIGLGPNKLIAKIASDAKKPDGLTVVGPEAAEKFLEPLSIRVIPGVGPKTEILFNRLGIQTVRDLRAMPHAELENRFGKWGGELYDKARGIDRSPVVEEYEAKSVGEQETFPRDTRDAGYVAAHLAELASGVMRRFAAQGFQTYRGITVTVRFENFETKTRSVTLRTASRDEKMLRFEAMRLLLPFFDARENPRRLRLRLVGVRVEKLE